MDKSECWIPAHFRFARRGLFLNFGLLMKAVI